MLKFFAKKSWKKCSEKTLNAYDIQQLIDKKMSIIQKLSQIYKVLLDLTCKVIPHCH